MKYYASEAEENFFENNRFSDENLPTYKDIAFILNIDMNLEIKVFATFKDEVIPKSLWEKIKKVTQFDYSLDHDFPNLREQVFKAEPKYEEYLKQGKILGFENYIYNGVTLKEALKDVNISTYSSMYEYFSLGENIGTCGMTSILTGVMFDDILCCKGDMKAFKGTPASKTGNHAWIKVKHEGKNVLIDTSLLLVIPEEYAKSLGYIPENAKTVEEMCSYSDMGDIYWEQYHLSKGKSTKNKASYELFTRNKEKIVNKVRDEER